MNDVRKNPNEPDYPFLRFLNQERCSRVHEATLQLLEKTGVWIDDPECLERIRDINEAYEVLSHSKKRRAYLQHVKEHEINYYRQMANASHENHPFFAYFMRFDNMTWVKEWMEKDSKKTEGD